MRRSFKAPGSGVVRLKLSLPRSLRAALRRRRRVDASVTVKAKNRGLTAEARAGLYFKLAR